MSDRLHDEELPIKPDLVRSLVDDAAPQWSTLPLTPLDSTGSTNRLFRLGDELVVRLPRQREQGGSIGKEARWTPVLAPYLPVQVPEVVLLGDPSPSFPAPWSVMRWIEGDHPAVLEPGESPAVDMTGLANDLVAVITSLRGVPLPPDDQLHAHRGELHGYRGDPLHRLDAGTRKNLARCAQLDDFGYDLAAAEQVWDEAMRLPPTGPAVDSAMESAEESAGESAPSTWYHGDLAAENLLVRDGRLAAVLDFGGVAIGDPTVDLIVAWQVLDPAGREVFRAALGVDDITWLRGRAWALAISLMVWYYWQTMPQRRADQMAAGRAVLTDAGFSV